MVIEDADHRPTTTLAVLRFFDQRLRAGDTLSSRMASSTTFSAATV